MVRCISRTLLKRLKKSKNRPLLNNDNKNFSIKKLYFLRRKFYKDANYKIRCDKLTLKQILEKIMGMYEISRNKI